jgi:hypothetical protein
MWPKLRKKDEKEDDKERKTIAQLVAGDKFCLACGRPAEIFDVDDKYNFCLDCYAEKLWSLARY